MCCAFPALTQPSQLSYNHRSRGKVADGLAFGVTVTIVNSLDLTVSVFNHIQQLLTNLVSSV